MFKRTEGFSHMSEAMPFDDTEAMTLVGPRLRYLDKAFDILRRPEVDPEGGETTWRELAGRVQPYHSGIELADNVRAATLDFVGKKIPELKEAIPAINNTSDEAIAHALCHGWFEEISEEAGDEKRSQILLAVAAHIVRRIENYTSRHVLEAADQEHLESLGLDAGLRDLLVRVLDASAKADPLYIRFRAFAQLTPRPPKEALGVTFHIPGREGTYTTAQLFPHEAQFIARRFRAIAEESEQWINHAGGQLFKAYLETIVAFYEETDSALAEERQQAIDEAYKEVLSSPFPIILTHSTEGYYKEPYFDPELKVSLAGPEVRKEETGWMRARDAMADSLDMLNASEFAGLVREQPARGVVVLGGFGVNLTFNAVAQEKPQILVYMNEQIRAYDVEFLGKAIKWIQNAATTWEENPSAETRGHVEHISRTATVLHEFCHSIFPDDGPEAQRIGREALTILDEVKAEITYQALVPGIIAHGGLDETSEEWAIGMVTSSLQLLTEQPVGGDYYYAAAYCLNSAVEQGALVFDGNQVAVTNYDRWYQIQRESANALLALYRNPHVTERKAMQWIEQYCAPNQTVKDMRERFSASEKS